MNYKGFEIYVFDYTAPASSYNTNNQTREKLYRARVSSLTDSRGKTVYETTPHTSRADAVSDAKQFVNKQK